MKANQWIAGLGILGAVSLMGALKTDASAFQFAILSDDLSNSVYEPRPWEGGSKKDGSDSASGGVETAERGVQGAPEVKDNNGHGNNVDGVDSSNKGASKEGEDTGCDANGENCVDDEKGSLTLSTESSDTETKTSGGNGSSK